MIDIIEFDLYISSQLTRVFPLYITKQKSVPLQLKRQANTIAYLNRQQNFEVEV